MARMSHRELLEWMMFYSLEPFHEDRAELQMANLCFMVASAFAGKGRRPKSEDFMVTRQQPKREPTVTELRDKFRLIAMQHNAAIRANGGRGRGR